MRRESGRASFENPPRFSFKLSCSFITLSIIFSVPECFEGKFSRRKLCATRKSIKMVPPIMNGLKRLRTESCERLNAKPEKFPFIRNADQLGAHVSLTRLCPHASLESLRLQLIIRRMRLRWRDFVAGELRLQLNISKSISFMTWSKTQKLHERGGLARNR